MVGFLGAVTGGMRGGSDQEPVLRQLSPIATLVRQERISFPLAAPGGRETVSRSSDGPRG